MVKKRSFTLSELAELTQAKLVGNSAYLIDDVADLESAEPSDASFLSNPRYLKDMQTSQAGVIFVDGKTPLLPDRNYLITDNPSKAFQKITDALYGDRLKISEYSGIHPTAVVHPTSRIGQHVTLSPHAVIDAHVVIGDYSFIGPGCFIGPETHIGDHCVIHANVTIRERCILKNRVVIQPGAVIGACGFGYIQDKEGKHQKLNQLGNVEIEDDVEIGANTTIDRARFKTTRIGRGTKIDNLVQIGHGVVIGEDNIIIAQTGIAGSTSTGKWVILAGQVAVSGHLEICDQVIVAARSGVTKSLKEPGKYGGVPAVPLAEHNRQAVHQRKVEQYASQIKELQERLERLEKLISSS